MLRRNIPATGKPGRGIKRTAPLCVRRQNPPIFSWHCKARSLHDKIIETVPGIVEKRLAGNVPRDRQVRAVMVRASERGT